MKALVLSLLTFFSALQARDFPLEELNQRVEQDISFRLAWIQSRSDEDAQKIRAQEQENTRWLQEELAYGLPGEEVVVDPIADLVLYSSDLAFQERVLQLYETSSNEDWREHIPTLTDRILLRRGLPQRYGTHFYTDETGQLALCPLEDAEQVDALRDAFDEEPLQEYVRQIHLIHRARGNERLFWKLSCLGISEPNALCEDIDSYLFYATTPSCQEPPCEDHMFLAFDDPALAISYAFCKEVQPYEAECFYSDGALQLTTALHTQRREQIEPSLQHLRKPITLHLVKRAPFQLYEPYRSSLNGNVFYADARPTSEIELDYDTILEPLLASGSKFCFTAPEASLEIDLHSRLKGTLLSRLFFQVTMENENFSLEKN